MFAKCMIGNVPTRIHHTGLSATCTQQDKSWQWHVVQWSVKVLHLKPFHYSRGCTRMGNYKFGNVEYGCWTGFDLPHSRCIPPLDHWTEIKMTCDASLMQLWREWNVPSVQVQRSLFLLCQLPMESCSPMPCWWLGWELSMVSTPWVSNTYCTVWHVCVVYSPETVAVQCLCHYWCLYNCWSRSEARFVNCDTVF